MKMMKRITAILAATLMISLPMATASPRSDGYYGKTKVGPKAQVEAYPFDLITNEPVYRPKASAMAAGNSRTSSGRPPATT
jgi:hypothetical protein